MPTLDELEHDSHEDVGRPNAVAPQLPRPRVVARPEPEPKARPWLDVENPAIWEGDIGDD